MLTVSQLTPKQRFYVIFYSDTAYPMMHPNSVSELQPATSRNKELLYYWLQSVQLCLKTNGTEAIQMAFDTKVFAPKLKLGNNQSLRLQVAFKGEGIEDATVRPQKGLKRVPPLERPALLIQPCRGYSTTCTPLSHQK